MFLSGSSGNKSVSKLIQVVGLIRFLVAVGLRSLFPWWLSAGLVLLKAAHFPSHAFYVAPLML